MNKKPEEFRVSLVAPNSLKNIVGVAFILSLGVLSTYLYGLSVNVGTAQTMAFTTLVLLEFVRLASVRAEFNVPFWSNWLVVGALFISIFLQILLVYVPFLQNLFHTVPLSIFQWCIMLAVSCITWCIYRVLFATYTS